MARTRKKSQTQALTLHLVAWRLLKWFGIGIASLIGAVVLLVVGLIAVEIIITRPTLREQAFMMFLDDYRQKNESAAPLAALIPRPWEKVCFVAEYTDVNTETIRQRYGANVSTWHMSGEFMAARDGDGALVLFPAGEKPWALRVDTFYFADLKDGDCVGRDYMVRLN